MNTGLIQAALDRSGNDYSVSDVQDMIDNGLAYLIESDNASVVYQYEVLPKSKKLHIWLAAGSLDDVRSIGIDLINHAEQNGLDAVTLSGRLGWQKALDDLGFKAQTVNLVRYL